MCEHIKLIDPVECDWIVDDQLSAAQAHQNVPVVIGTEVQRSDLIAVFAAKNADDFCLSLDLKLYLLVTPAMIAAKVFVRHCESRRQARYEGPIYSLVAAPTRHYELFYYLEFVTMVVS